jgi:hypothetical protein
MLARLRVDGSVGSHGGLRAVCVISGREMGVLRSGAKDGWAIAIAIAKVEDIKATSMSQVVRTGSGECRVWDGLGRGCCVLNEEAAVPWKCDCQGMSQIIVVSEVLGNNVLERLEGQGATLGPR